MRCMLCGSDNRDEANHCKGCGATIGKGTGTVGSRKVQPTILEQPQLGGASNKTRIVTPEEMSNLDTAVSKNDGSGHGKKTQYVPPEAMKAQAASVQASVLPPLSGFLVTYSWDTAGLWFPVREGKNTYGSGKSCDGVVHQDRALSGEHFAIMCRNGEIRVRDLASTNATVVDGNEVWGETVVATHGSNIRAGDTTFVLVLIPGRNAQKKGEQP